jgi:hypothetical protein
MCQGRLARGFDVRGQTVESPLFNVLVGNEHDGSQGVEEGQGD